MNIENQILQPHKKSALKETTHNTIKCGGNMLNQDNSKNKNVTVEYGNKDLRSILSTYLIEKFIEEINKENDKTKN